MNDRNRTGMQLIFLQGRVDGCAKTIIDLQQRIDADKERIEELKAALRPGSESIPAAEDGGG